MIELLVFNKELELQGEISDYESLELELNYTDVCKMVLRVPRNENTIRLLRKGNILTRNDDVKSGFYIDHFSSVLENKTVMLEIYAYSMNYLLSWRVTPKQQRYTGTVEKVIKDFVNYNCIDTVPDRVIDRLKLSPDKGGFINTESSATGKNVLDHCFSVAADDEASLSVNIDITTGELELDVWKGISRSVNQSVNNRVMFSTDFDNVLSYEYFNNDIDLKNVCYVAGEGEGVNRTVVESGSASGWDRRETYVDARDLQSEYQDENGNDVVLTEPEYLALLEKRAFEELSETKSIESFESTVDDVQYIVGRDYWLGDLVTFYDQELNVTMDVRVNSINIVSDREGVRYKPSFGTGIPSMLRGGK